MMRYIAMTLLLLISSSAAAQEKTTFIFGLDPVWLSVNEGASINVHAEDNVSGGCWKNVEATKNAVALELQRSGYNAVVDSKEFNRIWFVVEATGYYSSGCIVTYMVKIYVTSIAAFSNGNHKIQSAASRILWQHYGLISGPKSRIDQRLKEGFVEMTQSFLLSVPRERREVLSVVVEKAAKDGNKEAAEFWRKYR